MGLAQGRPSDDQRWEDSHVDQNLTATMVRMARKLGWYSSVSTHSVFINSLAMVAG